MGGGAGGSGVEIDLRQNPFTAAEGGSGAVTDRRADALVAEHGSANCTPVLHPWLEIGGEKRTTRRK